MTYPNASGTPTLAIYFVGYGTSDVYFTETTDPSSSGNWSQPIQAGAPLPQGASKHLYPGAGAEETKDIERLGASTAHRLHGLVANEPSTHPWVSGS